MLFTCIEFSLRSPSCYLAKGTTRGTPEVAAQKHLKAKFEVVTRSGEAGFMVIPQRWWIVERSIAWLTWFRRLNRDYEANIEVSEAWVLLASSFMMN